MQTTQGMPAELLPQAQAALKWINETQAQTFELTGLVDYEQALAGNADQPFEFGLVLCDGEICAREQVRFQPVAGGYEFSLAEQAQRDIPCLLDPPEGARQAWLAGELQKHEFVVLLFYRGLW
ncbi:MAG: hypothetical protein O3A63_20625 [Proteobacteria bacterium]|nr:hypothetical protein [Pseudomonadota bacterium]